jgi:hypothetical protein
MGYATNRLNYIGIQSERSGEPDIIFAAARLASWPTFVF